MKQFIIDVIKEYHDVLLLFVVAVAIYILSIVEIGIKNEMRKRRDY